MYDYFMFHKPAECITARRDEQHKTVMDYFPEEMRNTHFPVGRLDKDTEGLLIITNDGKFAKAVLSPENKIKKTYFFHAQGVIDECKRAVVCSGVRIYKNRATVTAPAEMKIETTGKIPEVISYLSLDDQKLAVRKPHLPIVSGIVTITEGKKHQVKRMVRYAGARVLYLKRLQIASLILDDSLPKGEYRSLTDEEKNSLFMAISYISAKK